MQHPFLSRSIAVLCMMAFTHADAQNISTYAGNGVTGSAGDGGPATAASLNNPAGAYCDGGTIYVVEYNGARIRKIDLTGNITTFAGNGTVGFGGDGGPATAASLNTPIEIVKDHVGNFYIVDNSNDRIRKINASGTITTFAGTGVFGYTGDGGQATAAELNWPNRIAVDDSDNVYFTDAVNNCIRKVNTSGIITTVVGDGTGSAGYSGDGGPATAATLSNPLGVAFDVNHNMIIADGHNHVIRKVDNITGFISTIAGNGTAGYGGDGGPATAAMMQLPGGVVVDYGCNIYVTDWTDQRVRKITPGGNIYTVVGTGTAGFTGDGGPATLAEIDGPDNLAFDIYMNLYIPDFYNNRIRKIAALGDNSGMCMPATTRVGNLLLKGQYFDTYPNPSSGIVNFYQKYTQDISVNATAINMAGQTVYNGVIAFSDRKATLDMSGNAPGIYYVRLATDGHFQTLPIEIIK